MKHLVSSLLLLSQLYDPILAQNPPPTLTPRDAEVYLAPVTNAPPQPTGGDIEVIKTDGLDVYLGPDVVNKLDDALRQNCVESTDENCMKAVSSALGVGPSENGLQKRIIPVLIAAAPYLAAATVAFWAWAFHRLYIDNPDYKPVKIHIPAAETSSIKQWPATDTFVFESSTSTLAPIPTPDPTTIPTVDKKEDGSYEIHIDQVRKDAINHALSHLTCERQTDPSQCVALGAEAILQMGQAGGDLGPLLFVARTQFPQIRNQLMLDLLPRVLEMAQGLFFGVGGNEAVQAFAEEALWFAFLGLAAHIPIDLSTLIPKSIADGGDAPEPTPTPSPTSSGGPCKYKPFCTNCGGNAGGNKCVGHPDGKKKGCDCYPDERKEVPRYSDTELEAAIQDILSWPDYEKMPDKPEEPKGLRCIGLDGSGGWMYRDDILDAAKKYCNVMHPVVDGDWNDEKFDLIHSVPKGVDKETNEDCLSAYQRIIDGCDTNSFYNTKHGGIFIADSGIKYELKIKNKEDFKCNDPIKDTSFVRYQTLKENIEHFCQALPQGIGDRFDSGSRKYNEGSPDEVEIKVEWGPGAQGTTEECLRRLLRTVADACIGGEDQFNYKHGGYHATDYLRWTITPKAPHMPDTISGDGHEQPSKNGYACRGSAGNHIPIKKHVLQHCLNEYWSWDVWDRMDCAGMVGFSREGSGGWKSSRDCGNACVRYLSDAIASGASTAWCYTRATFASCRIGYEAVPYFPNNDCGPFNQPGYT